MNSREEQLYTQLVSSGYSPERARRLAVERAEQERRESSNRFWTIVRVAIVLLFAFVVASAAASLVTNIVLRWVIGVATFIAAFLVGMNVQYWLRLKMRMGLFGRHQEPLEPPTPMSESVRLPDVRLLQNKRLGKERGDFLEAVLARAETSSYKDRSLGWVAELVSMLPPNQHSPDALFSIARQPAVLGIAVADEERARGWDRAGSVDAVVRQALDWDLRNAATKANEDWITGTLATYMLEAGYYLARTGEDGQAAVRNGMRRFAQAIADDADRAPTDAAAERSPTLPPPPPPP